MIRHRPRRPARALAAALLLAVPLPAGAQRPGQALLYDPQPPAGSAYLRFVNALGAELALQPDFLPARRLGLAPEERVSAYAVVERVAGRPLRLEASAPQGSARVALQAEPGSFVTVILHPGADGGVAHSVVVDPADFNRARARLSFYNATADCSAASLGLEPAGPTVFEQVPPGAARARSVNPVRAQLRAACGEAAAPGFPLEGLEAGSAYSIWLMRPGAGAPLAFVSRDVTTRWQQ